MFLHDQSLCQTSRVTKKFLSDEVIAAIHDWPTQNPDHNRRQLKTWLINGKPKNLQNFWIYCQEELLNILDETIY